MENVLIPDVEGKIINLRGQQVILDCDVAELYGVQTKEINQAVKNNPRKFPEGYIFELDDQEKIEVVKIFDHLQNLRFSPQHPKAFTERGLYMLATILKGERAEHPPPRHRGNIRQTEGIVAGDSGTSPTRGGVHCAKATPSSWWAADRRHYQRCAPKTKHRDFP